MGSVRRLSPLRRLFDRGYREALRHSTKAKDFQVVDYTDGGLAIKMPVEMVHMWEAMPPEARKEFMDDVDRQKPGGGAPHEWRGV